MSSLREIYRDVLRARRPAEKVMSAGDGNSNVGRLGTRVIPSDRLSTITIHRDGRAHAVQRGPRARAWMEPA